jgi:hypothetical protein
MTKILEPLAEEPLLVAVNISEFFFLEASAPKSLNLVVIYYPLSIIFRDLYIQCALIAIIQ